VNTPNPKIKIQRIITFVAIFIFAIKITAWILTKSIAIYTDALESIVNIVAGFLGLYSVWLSAQPKDKNHPYGHGKVEYISSAIEGSLIFIAGIIIIFEAITHFIHPQPISELSAGIWLISLTALINGALGWYAIQYGKKINSIAIETSGKHLITDTYSTIGIILGLIVINFTQIIILDTILASIMGLIIVYNGYKVIRKSLAGIMDEADMNLLKDIIKFANSKRKPDWIDLHNLRAIQYIDILHIDAHMTIPWYYDVQHAHDTVKQLEDSIKIQFNNKAEFFIHTDPCSEKSCKLCMISKCAVRKHPFNHIVEWNINNVLENKQHHINQ
jgi:cation diffusion facilitator family transporter